MTFLRQVRESEPVSWRFHHGSFVDMCVFVSVQTLDAMVLLRVASSVGPVLLAADPEKFLGG